MAILTGNFEKMLDVQTQNVPAGILVLTKQAHYICDTINPSDLFSKTIQACLYGVKNKHTILNPIGVAPLDVKTASGGNGTNLLVQQYWG